MPQSIEEDKRGDDGEKDGDGSQEVVVFLRSANNPVASVVVIAVELTRTESIGANLELAAVAAVETSEVVLGCHKTQRKNQKTNCLRNKKMRKHLTAVCKTQANQKTNC